MAFGSVEATHLPFVRQVWLTFMPALELAR